MSTRSELAPVALALFREGMDTSEIARQMGLAESIASRLVWYARSSERGLPADFIAANPGPDEARHGRIKTYTLRETAA